MAEADALDRERRIDRRLLSASSRISEAAAAAESARDSADRSILPAASPAEAAASLAVILDQYAQQAGVRISSTSVTSDSAFVGRYASVSVRAFATCDILGLIALLRRVEGQDLLLMVREMTITQPEPAADDRSPESLRVELLVESIARRGTAVASLVAGAP